MQSTELDGAITEAKRLLGQPIASKDALALFDELPAVDCDFMLGRWRGSEVISGHSMDGLLDLVGWYGKQFIDEDNVHPLLFYRSSTRLFSVNPMTMPLGLMKYRLPRWRIYRPLLRLLRPIVGTRKSKARLRMLEHRGKVSAAMCYDQLPINDCFRKLDDDTVLGVMDQKGAEQPYFFILARDDMKLILDTD
ncbi:MAG: hypothetical protein DHS20C11_34190 [Lysobacteraceae bacterium]|nr:MAG: hypothetical protein DHS20C11_34190 [Xanthomonadaceae bacterium]